MKKPFLFGAILFASAAFAASRTPVRPDSSGVAFGITNVTAPTTAAELAAGCTIAIPQMTLKRLVIYAKREGKTIALRGIRSAKAGGAVLQIGFSAGDRMAINAENIVLITDGPRTP